MTRAVVRRVVAAGASARRLAVLCLTALAMVQASTAFAAKAVDRPAAELRPFDVSAASALRRQHAGKPWVLVLWSVGCEPCRAEMPHWAALRREHPELAIELVSTDSEGDREMAVQLLARAGLMSEPGWIFADDFVERLRYAVDPGWHGELPRTLFYEAGGRYAGRSGVVDAAWIAAWIRRQREAQ